MDEPAAASTLVTLLNSRSFGEQPDQLGSPDLAAPCFEQLGVTDGDINSRRLAALRGVRDSLCAIVDEDTDDKSRTAAWDDVTGRFASVTFRPVFRGEAGAELAQRTGDTALGRVALAIADLMRAGQWSRLRLCANPDCRGAFFDTTRSRTRRWHSYELCGNRLNVAAHRAAHR
ncbi:CGNR zinc finger domain-containing protein [Streptomyces sp. NPDC091215]|uniref:CGNR zinc finger domain-containing protein n=1 Tax=Streptomyces sp. NPDC091215 TaxID=3155192 RepID=UPI0034353567